MEHIPLSTQPPTQSRNTGPGKPPAVSNLFLGSSESGRSGSQNNASDIKSAGHVPQQNGIPFNNNGTLKATIIEHIRYIEDCIKKVKNADLEMIPPKDVSLHKAYLSAVQEITKINGEITRIQQSLVKRKDDSQKCKKLETKVEEKLNSIRDLLEKFKEIYQILMADAEVIFKINNNHGTIKKELQKIQ